MEVKCAPQTEMVRGKVSYKTDSASKPLPARKVTET